MSDILGAEIISEEALRRLGAHLIPRLLASLCLAGCLVCSASLTGVALGFFVPGLQSPGSGNHVREDVMWVLFLTQLIILLPSMVWLWTRQWQQVEFDSPGKVRNRVYRGLLLLAIGAFVSASSSLLEAVGVRIDSEFLGVAIMHCVGALALCSFLGKYRISRPGAHYDSVEHTGSYRVANAVYYYMALGVFTLAFHVVLFHDKLLRLAL